ncbi:hypothetical protein COBT_000330 [Conglomerata obtusa]
MSVNNDEKNEMRDCPYATELAFISQSFDIDTQELQNESKKNHSSDDNLFFLHGNIETDYVAYDYSANQMGELQLINSMIEDECEKSSKIWNKFANEDKQTIWDLNKTHDSNKHEINMIDTVEFENKKKNLFDVANKPINTCKLLAASISPKSTKKRPRHYEYKPAFGEHEVKSKDDILRLLEQMKIFGKVFYEILNKKNLNDQSKQTLLKNQDNISFNSNKSNVDVLSVNTNNEIKISNLVPCDIPSSKRQKTKINRCDLNNPKCVKNYKIGGLCQFCFKILTFMDLFDINHNKDHFKLKTMHYKLAKYCKHMCTNLFYMLNHLETPDSMQNITVFMNFQRKDKKKSVEMYRKLAYEEFTLNLKKIAENKNDTKNNACRTNKIEYQKGKNSKHINCLSHVVSQFVKFLYFDIQGFSIMNRLHCDSATKSQDIINRRNTIIQNFIFIIDDLLNNKEVEIIISDDLFFRWRMRGISTFCDPKTFLKYTIRLGFKINYCDQLCDFFDFMSKIFTDGSFQNKINIKNQSFIGSELNVNNLNKEVFCDKSDIYDEKMFQCYLSELFRYNKNLRMCE